MEHVLEAGQYDRATIEEILKSAAQMSDVVAAHGDQRLNGAIMATLFYEPSTRTRLSFESAMYRLGGQVISSEMAAQTSSAAKGESIEDTTRIVESYADLIVIRHPVAGAARKAASVSSIPIINAGDGPNEHPTQSLIDLFTISQELGRIDDLTIALVGDLRYGRAPRSLATLLTRCTNITLILVSPPPLRMADDVIERLDAAGVNYVVSDDLASVFAADVVYMTRIQKERFPDEASYEAVKDTYTLGMPELQRIGDSSILMHPLPRVTEVSPDVDADRRAAYFRQARNGVYVRMALIDRLLAGRIS